MGIEDIKISEHQMNRGTDRGAELLRMSVRELGLFGSVTVDRSDRVLCGSKVVETAMELGISKVRVVETDGDTLVVVKRTDVGAMSKKGLDIQLVDNLCSEQNLSWDAGEVLYLSNRNLSFYPQEWNAQHALVEDLDIGKYLKEGVKLVSRKNLRKQEDDSVSQMSFFDAL